MLKKVLMVVAIVPFLAGCLGGENPEGLRDEVIAAGFVHEASSEAAITLIDADVLDVEQAELVVAASDTGLVFLNTARDAAEAWEQGGDQRSFAAALSALSSLARQTGRIQSIIDLVADEGEPE